MRPKGKRMLAWLLATTVTLSGNSFTVLADELDEEIQEEPLFSAGEEENNQDPEEYKIWFENLRDDEYSTYFFDNENGELRLNTENLNGKNASTSWEVGSRTNDPG